MHGGDARQGSEIRSLRYQKRRPQEAFSSAWARERRPEAVYAANVGGAGVGRALEVILPGKRLLCEALTRGTAQLRNVRFSGPDWALSLGRDTDEAVRFGNCYMIVGALRYIVAEVRARYGEDIRILFDGGDAAELAGLVGAGSTHDPGLVLEGLAYFAGLGQ